MKDIDIEILRSLEKEEKVALATLIGRVGSAPRAVGAKFLVKANGTSIGSIGGGCVEAEVWQEAEEVIKKGEARVLHFSLSEEQLAEGGLICGGNIDILLEPITQDVLKIYQELVRIKQKGGVALLVTLISADDSVPKPVNSKMLLRPSDENVGSLLNDRELHPRIWAEGEKLLKERKPGLAVIHSKRTDSPWKKVEVWLEPIASEPTVFLFGGGHITQQVAPLAKRVHFKVVVVDDREMFANRDRFPDADQVLVSEFEKAFESLRIDDSSYIVIVTRGHLYDGFVLEQAVKTNARYVGMIGSKRKIRTLYQNLMGKGVRKEVLDQVHAPIGLDINSETPEEIAVSIVAELIKVRGESPTT